MMIMMMMMIIAIIIFRTFGGQCSLMLYVVIGLPLMMLFLAQVFINYDWWSWCWRCLYFNWALLLLLLFFTPRLATWWQMGSKQDTQGLRAGKFTFDYHFHFHFHLTCNRHDQSMSSKFTLTFTLLAIMMTNLHAANSLSLCWHSWWPICKQQIHFHFFLAGKFKFTFTLLANSLSFALRWQSWWPICEQQFHFHFYFAGKFKFRPV